jgi:hypothetical protein
VKSAFSAPQPSSHHFTFDLRSVRGRKFIGHVRRVFQQPFVCAGGFKGCLHNVWGDLRVVSTYKARHRRDAVREDIIAFDPHWSAWHRWSHKKITFDPALQADDRVPAHDPQCPREYPQNPTWPWQQFALRPHSSFTPSILQPTFGQRP